MNVHPIHIAHGDLGREVTAVVAVVPMRDHKLEKLVHRPGNGCGWHLVDHPGPHAPQETVDAPEFVHSPECRSHAINVGEVRPGTGLLRVEKCLAHIQWHGHRSSYRPSHSTRAHVRSRAVAAVVVQEILHHLIHDKLDALEGHVHHQLCGVAAVECPHALLAQNASGALPARPVTTAENLHTLLHHCNTNRKKKKRKKKKRWICVIVMRMMKVRFVTVGYRKWT